MPYAKSPSTCTSTLFKPNESPGVKPRRFMFQPFCFVYPSYIRSSICTQSQASSPPTPAKILMRHPLLSYCPLSKTSTSIASRSFNHNACASCASSKKVSALSSFSAASSSAVSISSEASENFAARPSRRSKTLNLWFTSWARLALLQRSGSAASWRTASTFATHSGVPKPCDDSTLAVLLLASSWSRRSANAERGPALSPPSPAQLTATPLQRRLPRRQLAAFRQRPPASRLNRHRSWPAMAVSAATATTAAAPPPLV
mmetsp:Transcript_20910/g.58422  ORF Transcript_20910/g.58422 Transcript_20910/m.58422 type:complete len:259 (+) Transcript_20910:605-1381(+)